MKRIVTLLAGVLALAAPKTADAFCGFYVGGADAKLFNNATVVAMMREGNRTVLSMQNNYQGPPQNFAMVVPVPVILSKENVKTLPRDLFERIDALTAPRLVEYWEQDPCAADRPRHEMPMPVMAESTVMSAPTEDSSERHHVKIEARFSVGEYDILILSAKDSSGLDAWLHESGYSIPNGAEPLLRPYVQMGMKFFVAKVDVTKVAISPNGQTMLSPLRFHYDADAFFLPIRLGLVNSAGTQDLIVSVLARGQRYEVSNYDNVSIPTNLELDESAKGQFGAMYAALFDKTIEKRQRAVVTEYAWEATSCDPCPTPSLTEQELLTLGADVLPSANDDDDESGLRNRGFVVTRLHLRYAKGALGDDLFFRPAHAIEGGREHMVYGDALEKGAHPGEMNNFQARYVIRHPWTGAIACANPRRGIWGGPNGQYMPMASPATNLAFAPRGKVQLAALIKSPLPDGDVLSEGAPTPPLTIPKSGGCAGCQAGGGGAEIAGGALGTIAILGAWRRRRKERSA